MSTSIVYARETYVEPDQGSAEEMSAYNNITTALGTFRDGVACTYCQTIFEADPDQCPPCITLYCNCGDLVVLFDQNTTIVDALLAIINRFTVVEQQYRRD
jgi:RNA polymerase subunit RPABC4/transcription elongation factor Spt4